MRTSAERYEMMRQLLDATNKLSKIRAIIDHCCDDNDCSHVMCKVYRLTF